MDESSSDPVTSRLVVLRRFHQGGGADAEPFAKLVRLAAALLGAPAALFLRDGGSLFLAAGTEADDSARRARELALAERTAAAGEPLALAGGEPGGSAYLGVPIAPPGGPPIGVLHAVAEGVREWSAADAEGLAALADSVLAEVDLRAGALQLEAERARFRRARQRLARAETHYRRIVVTSPQVIYSLDDQGRFTELNPAGETLLQRTQKNTLGVHFAEVIAPDDLPLAQDTFRRLATGEVETTELELCIQRPSGEQRPVHIVITAVTGPDGFALHGIARDIADERARDRRMRLYTRALDTLRDGVSVTDRAGRIVYANEAHARMFGYVSEDPPPEGLLAFLPPDESVRVELEAALRRAREHGAWQGNLSFRRMDGEVIPVEARIHRVEDEGRPLLFSIVREIAAELEQEQRLRRAERLASLGTLIGEVAHELNNPLSAIRGFTELLLGGTHAAQDREDLETIARESSRMARIVADLRLLVANTQTGTTAPREEVDVNEVVRHILKIRSYPLRTANVEVREDLGEHVPAVRGNRGALEQVVLNIVVNAEQALASMPESERLLIVRTRPSRTGAAIHVIDNGPGIATEHLARIFDPYFTTKPASHGTGLGLSLVHNLVSEHGGELRVESEPGRGAAFRIDLPRAPVPTPVELPPAATTRQPGALRILVVDDEASIRSMLGRYLRGRGHVVHEATQGAEALRLLEEESAAGPFDAVLSDLRMPGSGGEDLLRSLRQRGLPLPRRIVFMTGEASPERLERLTRETGVPVIGKPFPLAEVAELLESPPS